MIVSNVVSVGTSPTPICTGQGWVSLQCQTAFASGVGVVIGGPAVTTSTGIMLPYVTSGTDWPLPFLFQLFGKSNGYGDTVYGVVASSTASVAYLLSSFGG